jgi:hypothetical protein
VLLAPSKRTDFDGRENVGLPVMVGLLRRLYDWLLSLFVLLLLSDVMFESLSDVA